MVQENYRSENNQNWLSNLFNIAILFNARSHPIFAILTAIVTIEPTAKASLKKVIEDCPQL